MARTFLIFICYAAGAAMILIPNNIGYEFMQDPMPPFARWVMTGFGAIMLWVGYANDRHAKAIEMAEASVPRQGTIIIRKHEDSDSTSYHARVEVEGALWRVPLMGDKATVALFDDPGEASIWCHPDTGQPLVFERNGHRPQSMPTVQRLDKR